MEKRRAVCLYKDTPGRSRWLLVAAAAAAAAAATVVAAEDVGNAASVFITDGQKQRQQNRRQARARGKYGKGELLFGPPQHSLSLFYERFFLLVMPLVSVRSTKKKVDGMVRSFGTSRTRSLIRTVFDNLIPLAELT